MSLFTFREALVRKVFIFFLGISAFILIGLAAAFSLIDTEAITQFANPEGKDKMIREIISSLQLIIVTPLAGLCLLLSIFASSSFIPNMLEKGNIDLLLSKPVSRTQLMLGKYFGGILVVFVNIAFLVVGVWSIISLKFSYWEFNFLFLIVIITFTFAVLYALIVFFGITTRSSIPGMMIAYLIYLVLSPVLLLGKDKIHLLTESEIIRTLIKGLYYIVPKTSELMGSISLSLVMKAEINEFRPIISSFIFLIVIMIYSGYLFNKKNF
jgi:ABC-type transport system involved in multi-copper enzyme maturation permease subunit